MDIPFNLSFFTNTGQKLDATKFTSVYKELLEDADKFSIEVKENCDLTVLFKVNTSPLDWKLKIDVMDELPESCFTSEELQTEGDPFFYPTNEQRPLYLDTRSSIKGPKDVIYPMLIPGSYKIIIKNIRSKEIYLAFLRVIPLRIDDKQLMIMRDDVESYLKGLSMTMNKSSNMYLQTHKNNNNILYKTNLLLDMYKKLISTMNRIAKNPKYSIKKVYNINKIFSSQKTDSKTIKFKQKRMDTHDKLLTYKNTINYDIHENRMLKLIVYNLREEVKSCLNFLSENISREERNLDENLKYLKPEKKEVMYNNLIEQLNYSIQSQAKIKTILSSCNKLLHENWINLVKDVKYLQQPYLIARNLDYNVLYKVHLDLKSKINIKKNPLANYNYFWKESSKLYEIWGFLKLKETILSSDFEFIPKMGWIYDEGNLNEYQEIPFLDPETRITFENKDGIRIVLYYDSVVLGEKETILSNPVHTVESHNRPDFRIDIYIHDIYKKSIIGDFKYRSYSSLGNAGSYVKGNTSSYRQLLAYSNVRTLYTNKGIKGKRSKGIAYETWVFYPGLVNDKLRSRGNFDPATNIRRTELSPGKLETIEQFQLGFNKTINEILDE